MLRLSVRVQKRAYTGLVAVITTIYVLSTYSFGSLLCSFTRSVVTGGEKRVELLGLPTYTVVIARAFEDLGWLERSTLRPENVVIYDKGEQVATSKKYKIRILKNFGREASTLMFHVIVSYFDLPEYIIFLQGNPFPHMPGLTSENFERRLMDLLASRPNVSEPLFSPLHEESPEEFPFLHFDEHFKHYFGKSAPLRRRFAPGCQYVLTKSSILMKPVEFYLNMYSALRSARHVSLHDAHFKERRYDTNLVTPWDFERLVSYFFLDETFLNKSLQTGSDELFLK